MVGRWLNRLGSVLWLRLKAGCVMVSVVRQGLGEWRPGRRDQAAESLGPF